MNRRHIIICGLAIVVALWAGWSARAFFAVDRCLDAGGRWSSRGVCEGVLAGM